MRTPRALGRRGRPPRSPIAVVVAGVLAVAFVVAVAVGPRVQQPGAPGTIGAAGLPPAGQPSAAGWPRSGATGRPPAASVPAPALPVRPPTVAEPPLAAAPRPTAASVAGDGACPPGVPPESFTLRVPILMYHRIVDPALAGPALPGLVVPPGVFAAQLAAMHAAGWRTITLGELARDVADRRAPPDRTFVVTIDDGHLDGLTNALPILRGLGDVATYFVVTGRLGEPDDLTAADVQALAADGMEIGDHTLSHADLPALPLPIAQAQIQLAARAIASLTGAPPVSFAYPYGRVDEAVASLLHEDGFAIAVTTRECDFESLATALLTPRLRVSPDTSPAALVEEARRLSGGGPS